MNAQSTPSATDYRTDQNAKPLKIAFDFYWGLSGPPSGRNVVNSLVQAWVDEFPQDRLTLAVPRTELAAGKFESLGKLGVTFAPMRLRPHALSMLAELRGGVHDVIVTQNFPALRASKALRVTLLHDVIFLRHPEWFTRAERIYLRPASVLAPVSDLIWATSQSEANQIGRSIPAVADRTVSIGLALPSGFAATEPRMPESLDVTPRDFLLTVGRLNVRKNLPKLASALLNFQVISPQKPLIVVGVEDGMSIDSPLLQAARASGALKFVGGISDAELRWLYQNCQTFCFPSLDEGFGLPMLEAASSGSPIAASDILPFRELGLACSYFDPSDEASISEAVLSSMATDKTTLDHNRRRAAAFTWRSVVSSARESITKNLAPTEPA